MEQALRLGLLLVPEAVAALLVYLVPGVTVDLAVVVEIHLTVEPALLD